MKQMFQRAVIIVVLGLCGGLAAHAATGQAQATKTEPAAKPGPELTTEQKLAIRLAAKSMEAAQLKAQVAQAEFDAARRDLTDLVKSVDDKPGYTFDLQTLTYLPKPAGKDPGK